ncbi:PEP/pyruvate-binding domain-containing protein [Mariprofundus ferrooxydans]|uniref:PEP/pyruvate-binding domain-containing protein n=1 Tax=Mariprofundus ferrooxydans TaxID=314344 RepID=UPI00142F9F9E|nr:PEP/pyruvate-binding domain-containing protein [Mariprofundus ferrooxydans]
MFQANMRRFVMMTGMVMVLFIPVFPLHTALALGAEELDAAALKNTVDRFKLEARGPFRRIRWFCNDGSILPTGEYVCREHGGGRQHGQWSKQTLALRAQGYLVANVLAAVKPADFTGATPNLDELKQILLERYLIGADDGWVFRRARFYRGALQSEDEQVAATKILLALLADPAWRAPERFLLLREAVRMLPLPGDSKLASKVRQASSDLGEKDAGFHTLRVKIHGMPDELDAARVRAYARDSGSPSLATSYEQLARMLDALYAPDTGIARLKQLAADSRNRDFKRQIGEATELLGRGDDPAETMTLIASRMQSWRRLLQNRNTYSVEDRLRLLQASLVLEQEVFVRGNRLLESSPQDSRASRLVWLRALGAALNGAGMLSGRQWLAFHHEVDRLLASGSPAASEYYAALSYLARIPQWAQRSLEFHFSAIVGRWSVLTPLAGHMVPERLRNSPLLPYSRVLDQLVADAGRLVGIRHRVFGREIDSNVRALNPGLKRGVLLLPPAKGEYFRPDGIYILASTTQDLPPVAGIITLGEGSSLSHVQLLARNMGIPNLLADDGLLRVVRDHIGERVVLAVSRRGSVEIDKDGPQWDGVFGSDTAADQINIDADMTRLNLNDHAMYALRRIRAEDSGRIVGPKAANLGELRSHYPKMVPPGLVIPFGVFRRYLEQPLFAGGPAVFDWMRSEYAHLDNITDKLMRQRETSAFLARLRAWIITSDPGARFRQQLRFGFGSVFGKGDNVGVFVRSDTNVEDLPGFNGAGLNLTLPNVVGMDAIVDAIKQVWASPFSERAYAWRQSHMIHPEHVYPAVMLLQSFASEKSGVLVTEDVDTGDRNWLSVAVSEGVGGAVAGQAAEEIRVERATGRVRLLAQASAPWRVKLLENGGVEKVAASGREQLLTAAETEQLRELSADVVRYFPLPRDEAGAPMAADIEFGFRHGHLALFQLRPFIESPRARQSEALIAMDRQLPGVAGIKVDLGQAPQAGAP